MCVSLHKGHVRSLKGTVPFCTGLARTLNRPSAFFVQLKMAQACMGMRLVLLHVQAKQKYGALERPS